MIAVWRWIDERTGIGSLLQRPGERSLSSGASWYRAWPWAIGFAFAVQVITGLFVWMHYSPSVSTAWESVHYLQNEVVGGWLLRAMHHYAAQVLLVLIAAYVIHTVVIAGYRAPRELVFWVAVFMVLVTLGLMLTGDLLRWDQNGYSATKVRVSFLTLLPLVGEALYKLAVGGPGPGFGQLTLPRFIVLHVGVLSGSFALLLLLHAVFTRRADGLKAADAGAESAGPSQGLRNAAAGLAVVAVVVGLSLMHVVAGPQRGVGLGSPANPAESYAAARPEWAFLSLYAFNDLFTHYVTSSLPTFPIFILPSLLLLLFLAMPWTGRGPVGRVVNVGITALLLVAAVGLSVVSVVRDRRDPQFVADVAGEEVLAARAKQLVEHYQGVPATGALTLLKDDPKTQGPPLFAQQCASCHDHTDQAGNGIKAEKPSAPNLRAFASREWIAGLLDPKQIAGPKYFGNTSLARGKMVGFVNDLSSLLEPEDMKDREKLIMALSAEAGLKSQAEADLRDTVLIEEGRAMFTDFGCTDCHRFHELGSSSTGPNLTGYGSRQWIAEFIADPTAPHLYGDKNDRMPSYAPAGDPAQRLLGDHQIGLATDWLRGDWYEPEAKPAAGQAAEQAAKPAESK